jgi:excisionase family DNA binding protein
VFTEHAQQQTSEGAQWGTPEPVPRRLIDAKEAGKYLGCSWRTLLRLADSGRVPWGVKIGALRRWDIRELEEFVSSGCKPPRTAGRRVRS